MTFLLIYFLIFIFGTCIGSFLNVVILRLHSNEKIIRPRSHCPKCGYVLKWQENIPLLSFIILKGRCSNCQQKISWQYPLVELSTGVLFLISFILTIQQHDHSVSFLASNYFIILVFYWLVISFLTIIFIYDLKYYLIPDKISIPAITIVILFQILLILKNNSDYPFDKLRAGQLLITNYLFSAFVISGFFWLQYVISKGKWIGGGDIRLGFLMGLILGWPLGPMALFLAYILGLLIALPLLILGKKKLKSQVPFGTFLTSATLITLFWGSEILTWYFFKINFVVK